MLSVGVEPATEEVRAEDDPVRLRVVEDLVEVVDIDRGGPHGLRVRRLPNDGIGDESVGLIGTAGCVSEKSPSDGTSWSVTLSSA